MISMMMSSILFAKVPLQQGSQAKEAHIVHKTKDGSPRFTNALIHSKSTYLRQHAHQPIQWQAWQDSVLKRAENDQKMIFLSVGYATCHWCHVMARESF